MNTISIGGIDFLPQEISCDKLTIRKGRYGWMIIANNCGFFWSKCGIYSGKKGYDWEKLPGDERACSLSESELDLNVSNALASRFPEWSGTHWE
jgi:hypothetical protein